MNIFTTYNYLDIIKFILSHWDEVSIVGTGAQAEWMRNYLKQQCRLKLDKISGDSSLGVTNDKILYLICATPEVEAKQSLLDRGIPENKLIIWHDLYEFIEKSGRSLSLYEFGLPALNNEGNLLLPGLSEQYLSQYLLNASQVITSFLLEKKIDTLNELKNLEFMLGNYLLIRQHYASIIKIKPKKILFPSTGRCGGVSLTNALENHPSLYLKVCHEGYAEKIYMLLALYQNDNISKKMMTALTCFILDQYDCHGGNPFCFLMPFLKELSWFDFYMLKIERDRQELLESIIHRNFHYTEKDFVANRITAESWGVETKEVWLSRDIVSKVSWYIDIVEEQINTAILDVKVTIKTPIENITQGLNKLLKHMSLPGINKVPHLNTISKDRIYSLEERIELFKEIS